MTKDAADHMQEGGAEAVRAHIDQAIGGNKGNGRDHSAIDHALKVYDKWLALEDHTPIYATLGTIAANLLPGDPVWLGLVGPPSSAKTELLISTSTLPYVIPAATLTPAGLLSGVPKKQHAVGVKGMAGILYHRAANPRIATEGRAPPRRCACHIARATGSASRRRFQPKRCGSGLLRCEISTRLRGTLSQTRSCGQVASHLTTSA
jgi:hypothetical protein